MTRWLEAGKIRGKIRTTRVAHRGCVSPTMFEADPRHVVRLLKPPPLICPHDDAVVSSWGSFLYRAPLRAGSRPGSKEGGQGSTRGPVAGGGACAFDPSETERGRHFVQT
jgi:hypothetical protein